MGGGFLFFLFIFIFFFTFVGAVCIVEQLNKEDYGKIWRTQRSRNETSQ